MDWVLKIESALLYCDFTRIIKLLETKSTNSTVTYQRHHLCSHYFSLINIALSSSICYSLH
ncbi:hypothetical protein Plhal304r1_c007g0026801 [Plasmopara halstedii]